MNHSTHSISAEMLGAFLEGNLTPEESLQFEQLLADSELLQALTAETATIDIDWTDKAPDELHDMDWLHDLAEQHDWADDSHIDDEWLEDDIDDNPAYDADEPDSDDFGDII